MRSIDLAPAGLATPAAVAFFDQGGGRFLVADTVNASVIGFDGTPLGGGFNIRSGLNLLGVRDFSAITIGPNAGSFGTVDGDNCELVVFTLP